MEIVLDESPSRVESLLESHRYGRLSHQEFAKHLRVLSDRELKWINKLVLDSLRPWDPDSRGHAVR